MQENTSQKRNTKRIIACAIISFLCGILFDQYILQKFFSFGKNKCSEEIQETVESENIENTVEDPPTNMEDKKIIKDSTIPCSIYVDVSGAVKEPGVYCMPKGALIIDVVNKAGGFSNQIAYNFVSRKVNLAQKVVDNQKIYFPSENEMECKLINFLPEAEEIEIIVNNSTGDIGTTPSDTEVETEGNSQNSDSTECTNINSASLEELDALTGIGPSTAQKIIDGRPYQKIEDLLNVSGIGDATFAKFKDIICV